MQSGLVVHSDLTPTSGGAFAPSLYVSIYQSEIIKVPTFLPPQIYV